jgi:hypothetical protein
MKVPPAYLLLVLLNFCLPAWGQSMPPGAPLPPGYGPSAPTIYVPPYPGRSAPPRIDATALQRDAKELMDLSQSVQPEIESLGRGLLPKGLIDKLKRIEKLSKRLRSEISPH